MAEIELSVGNGAQGCVVALVTGDLDYVSASTFRPRVHALFDGRRRLVLDLSGVDFFDSAGLNELLALSRWAVEGGGSLALANVPGMMWGLLSLTGTDAVLDVHATVGEAVAGRRKAEDADGVGPGR
ncbi:STAS domain-containing protein [Streptomyces phaeochromogenes]|uniref:STAS domain-containing protein n=1 Tax=Streptomyces TaxID=1883 RepID=UPI0022532BBB|nr:STAS domain-containing protein [Streptomyces phaeochromogenes]MCX5604806.1 STAS domain-containing protein [Streptomyces phaeochromogenes]